MLTTFIIVSKDIVHRNSELPDEKLHSTSVFASKNAMSKRKGRNKIKLYHPIKHK
jgi:hypothetical protein